MHYSPQHSGYCSGYPYSGHSSTAQTSIKGTSRISPTRQRQTLRANHVLYFLCSDPLMLGALLSLRVGQFLEIVPMAPQYTLL